MILKREMLATTSYTSQLEVVREEVEVLMDDIEAESGQVVAGRPVAVELK